MLKPRHSSWFFEITMVHREIHGEIHGETPIRHEAGHARAP